MAEILFQLLQINDGTPAVRTLGGSGLAFYGSSAGSSVQIAEYQDKTYVASADGSVFTHQCMNTKYTDTEHPSGMVIMGGTFGGPDTVGLSGVKTCQGTIGIEFGHTTAVNIQNAQLRIYDRDNVNYPASGVNTKVAEIINHNGYAGADAWGNQGSIGNSADCVGSGDCLWWGEPWPAQLITKNYYDNSNAVRFFNGVGPAELLVVNGDSRLGDVTGDKETVGGTGIIVPLADSPGSGQKQLDRTEVADYSASTPGPAWPKWTQYLNDATKQALFFENSKQDFGDGTAGGAIGRTYGGTGVDTHHTWSIALSASPLSVGSKEQYGLYVSVEYL